jgi:alkylation response protein AidB-like acyl-CoA dehydrogenase
MAVAAADRDTTVVDEEASGLGSEPSSRCMPRARLRVSRSSIAGPSTTGRLPRRALTQAGAYQAGLYDAGLAGLTWPREYGGQGLPARYQTIFNDETTGFRMPGPYRSRAAQAQRAVDVHS